MTFRVLRRNLGTDRIEGLAHRAWLPLLLSLACTVSAVAQAPNPGNPGATQSQGRAEWLPATAESQPSHRVAERMVLSPAKPNEHPLMPAIRWAYAGMENIKQIQDYSAIMVKRERINGKLGDEEAMFVKVRHKPLSVYAYFLKPQGLQGQEVVWVDGLNDGKMWAHSTGFKKVFGTVSMNPTNPLAMQGNRYPITEIGFLNLIKRLIDVAERDSKYGECEVKFYSGAKINERVCTCIQVLHPVPRRNFLFHVARIFVDDELNVPIRYEAYDWPKEENGSTELMEQYTYLNLRLNNGYTDYDFDARNTDYNFGVK